MSYCKLTLTPKTDTNCRILRRTAQIMKSSMRKLIVSSLAICAVVGSVVPGLFTDHRPGGLHGTLARVHERLTPTTEAAKAAICWGSGWKGCSAR